VIIKIRPLGTLFHHQSFQEKDLFPGQRSMAKFDNFNVHQLFDLSEKTLAPFFIIVFFSALFELCGWIFR
jgi:hypothetical protein